MSVFGNAGDDTIDLSRVSAANGFTGINQPNFIDGGSESDLLIAGPFPATVQGGSGNDVIFVRNGVSDTVDCGPGQDAVQADRVGVDSLTNCEIVDFSQATGQQAAALKKCKKKHSHKARKKCKKKASLLPA